MESANMNSFRENTEVPQSSLNHVCLNLKWSQQLYRSVSNRDVRTHYSHADPFRSAPCSRTHILNFKHWFSPSCLRWFAKLFWLIHLWLFRFCPVAATNWEHPTCHTLNYLLPPTCSRCLRPVSAPCAALSSAHTQKLLQSALISTKQNITRESIHCVDPGVTVREHGSERNVLMWVQRCGRAFQATSRQQPWHTQLTLNAAPPAAPTHTQSPLRQKTNVAGDGHIL